MVRNITLLEFSGFDNFIEKLIPSWIDFVVQFVALILIIIAVIIFAYKPVKKIIKERQDYIEKNIKDSESAKAEYELKLKESDGMIIASKKQASEIIEKANLTAKENEAKAINETNEKIKALKLQAEQDILLSKQNALDDIHNEIVNVALEASKEVLQREIDEKDNAKLINDFIKDIK